MAVGWPCDGRVPPVEGPVPAGDDEQPVDHGGAIAGADDGDVLGIGRRVVRGHQGDQLQQEGHVVRLALFIVDVPAGIVDTIGHQMCLPALIATGRHNHHRVSEVAQATHVALATAACGSVDYSNRMVKNYPKYLTISI